MVFMQLNQRVILKDFASPQVKTNLDPRKCSIRFYLNGCKGNITCTNVIWNVNIFVFAFTIFLTSLVCKYSFSQKNSS